MLIGEIVQSGAVNRPGHPALIFDGRRHSFRQLADRVTRLSAAISELTEAGDRVSILADNCPEYIECLYGIPGGGAILNPLNQRLAVPELRGILENAAPSMLIVGKGYLDQLAQLHPDLPSVRHVIVIGADPTDDQIDYASLLSGPSAGGASRPVAADDPAWLIYTSGTTGRPKGALLSHRNIIAGILNTAMEWQPGRDDSQLFAFPLCHVVAYVPLMYHLRTATVILMTGFDAGRFLALIEAHRPTHTGLAPTMLNFLLEHPAIEDTDLSSIDLISYGAAPMAPSLLQRGIERFGEVFIQGYGMTELSGSVIVLGPDEHHRGLNGEPELLGAAGRSESLALVRLVDDAMNDVPVGKTGEIVVRGDQVMLGYWRADEATKEVFAGGWLHTGDLASRDEEGIFTIVDRKKDTIISGAENVYPREIEDVLVQHAAVLEAAVIGLPDDTWGEAVTAVVALRPGHQASDDELRRFCRAFLAGYKVPKQVLFTESLPRNAANKVLRRVLREQYTEG